MQHSSTSGPSRRWSPVSLDHSTFDAGTEQSLGLQCDYTQASATIGAMDEYYPYATQAGYANYMQTAGSSYHAPTAGRSSSYQYHNDLYPTNLQLNQQTGASYQGAAADWSTSAYHGHSARPSVSYSSQSSDQHNPATASSSSSQAKMKAKLPEQKKRTIGSQPAAPTSHSRSGDDKAKMRDMMGRTRLPIGGSIPMEAISLPSAVGDKRKDRTLPLPQTISAAEPQKGKKARPADMAAEKVLEAKRAREVERVQSYRDKQSSDIARLTEKLPGQLRVFNKDGPSPKNVGQAVIHIDNLENEMAQLRASQFQLSSRIVVLEAENRELRDTKAFQQQRLTEMGHRTRVSDAGQTWQYANAQFR